jgi:hypothetical protein
MIDDGARDGLPGRRGFAAADDTRIPADFND